jgi:hypothetical protein
MEKTDWSNSYSCKRLAQYLRIDELVSNLRATIFFIKSRFDQLGVGYTGGNDRS